MRKGDWLIFKDIRIWAPHVDAWWGWDGSVFVVVNGHGVPHEVTGVTLEEFDRLMGLELESMNG